MKRSKYGAKRTSVDGISFASKAEARRYGELRLLQIAGEISELELQPEYKVEINGVVCLRYRADFRYLRAADNARIVEDVKGCETALFRVKQRVVEAAYPGLKIEIVKMRAA